MAQSIFAMFDPVDWLLSSLLAAIPATIVDSKSSDSSYVPHERMQLGGSIRFSGTLGCDYMCNRTLQVDIPRNPPETQRERDLFLPPPKIIAEIFDMSTARLHIHIRHFHSK